MTSTARSAARLCARFIALFQQFISRAQDSIQPINRATRPTQGGRNMASDQHLYSKITKSSLTAMVLSWLEPIKGSERAASRIARSVAIAIGIALSMQSTAVGQGSISPYRNIKELADYQLTEVQEKCHNEIIYRESRYDIDAVNGSHHGYYQIRNNLVIDKPYDYQFYFYWKYVSHRYGITEYDEPDYCKALHHLRVKGWQ